MAKRDLSPQGLHYRLYSETARNLFVISAHNAWSNVHLLGGCKLCLSLCCLNKRRTPSQGLGEKLRPSPISIFSVVSRRGLQITKKRGRDNFAGCSRCKVRWSTTILVAVAGGGGGGLVCNVRSQTGSSVNAAPQLGFRNLPARCVLVPFPPTFVSLSGCCPPLPHGCFSPAITWQPAPPASAAAARRDIYPPGSRPGAFGRWEQQDGACLGVPGGYGRSEALGAASAPRSSAASPNPGPVSPGPDPRPARSSQAVFAGNPAQSPASYWGRAAAGQRGEGREERSCFLSAFVSVCVCVCVCVCASLCCALLCSMGS